MIGRSHNRFGKTVSDVTSAFLCGGCCENGIDHMKGMVFKLTLLDYLDMTASAKELIGFAMRGLVNKCWFQSWRARQFSSIT